MEGPPPVTHQPRQQGCTPPAGLYPVQPHPSLPKPPLLLSFSLLPPTHTDLAAIQTLFSPGWGRQTSQQTVARPRSVTQQGLCVSCGNPEGGRVFAGGCPVHWRMVSGLPGLYPLVAPSTPP